MKLLLIYTTEFGWTPRNKTLEDFPDAEKSQMLKDVQTAFIHVEAEDMENITAVEKKLLKNIKWAAGKNNTRRVVLHSFAHLSDSKGDPHFTKDLFNRVEERLKNSGYEVFQTPFGYFLDLEMKAPGYSTARVFKNI
ncbi:MAG TPA: hypothetical protein ENK25_05135 [Bacteroidetes bacterium]|nr:hypothetical protein [Bacteroidota bacterium]